METGKIEVRSQSDCLMKAYEYSSEENAIEIIKKIRVKSRLPYRIGIVPDMVVKLNKYELCHIASCISTTISHGVDNVKYAGELVKIWEKVKSRISDESSVASSIKNRSF